MTDLFSRCGSTRFAGGYDMETMSAEGDSQPLHLCALSAPVEPFKRNKPAAMGVARHGEIIAERLALEFSTGATGANAHELPAVGTCPVWQTV
jgi:hypothetical protein